MLLSIKFQNGAQIQGGRQKFLQVCLNLANFSSFIDFFLFLKIQNGRKIQYCGFFAQKFMIFW
jgi:hypothetical protein